MHEGPHFRGAFATYAEALAAARPGALAGYNHAEVAQISLEDFEAAAAPYQVCGHAAFIASIAGMGYTIEDAWDIPPLSRTHPTFGASPSRGFFARLK